MQLRHGTCSVSERYFPSMINKLDLFRKQIDRDNVKMEKSDIDAILAWEAKPGFVECPLIPEGNRQVVEFTRRLKHTLPELFNYDYTCANYQVLSLEENRCETSGQLFLETMFNTTEKILKCDNNPVLFKTGDLKKKDPEFKLHEQQLNVQIEAWKTSHFINNVARRVENKLGLGHGKVDFDILEAALESCCWGTAFHPENNSPWCSIFSERDHEIILHADNMFYWYYVGYGNTFNVKLGCGVTQQLVDYFKQSSGQKAIIHMALRSNIFTMYTVLGLGKQSEPLKADNYKGMDEMKWTTSRVIPFGANFMAVLFEKKGDVNEYEDLLVAFYFNENLTIIQLNNGTTCEYCQLSEVIVKLQTYLNVNECSKFNEL
ncbi:multiple inositol polyphosphate phosphatase 1-like isoform X2 [Adelges cooleyi]|nr:multiple inositol polyphosphate phosphatase 1-like isoform X2 [Adelges cooleyi]XP_050422280.1 multiple inositol polyphosphate phosphatase 1-like isoform X2 [Adelges cooleyi]XP_050422281.1 multiple inositol polyphosphate phosphatase 1-like isoform X2 [Adelges cooleyi]